MLELIDRASTRGIEKVVVQGSPDLDTANTSYVERHSVSIRMSMRRYTRLTHASSKKLEKHAAMLSLYSYWYHHVRLTRSGNNTSDTIDTPVSPAITIS